jgi:hypothetical protein
MKELNTSIPFEVKQAEAESRISKEFPTLAFDRFMLVDPATTRLAIDDVSYRARKPLTEELAALTSSLVGELKVYDVEALAKALEPRVTSLLQEKDPERTLLVFPGTGANVVLQLLMENVISDFIAKNGQLAKMPTKRLVNAKTGEIEGVEIVGVEVLRKGFQRSVDTIIVLDDVIASGATLDTIQAQLQIPSKDWYAETLMTLSPLQNRKRSTTARLLFFEYYQSVQSPIVYQGTTGIPPLNSLSTLIGTSEKSELVRSRYIDKYVNNKDLFMDSIASIRNQSMTQEEEV